MVTLSPTVSTMVDLDDADVRKQLGDHSAIGQWYTVPSSGLVQPIVVTANYTPALSDAGKAIEVNSTSNLTVTIPTEALVNFPIGTVIEVSRINTGTVTITGAGGVVLRSPGSALGLRAQYSAATLRKRASDDWLVEGDLA